MPNHILMPSVVQAVGSNPRRIEGCVGQVNTHDTGVSVARMVSPEGREEPGQRPAFREITPALKGKLRGSGTCRSPAFSPDPSVGTPEPGKRSPMIGNLGAALLQKWESWTGDAPQRGRFVVFFRHNNC
jgi:hypothetical protein